MGLRCGGVMSNDREGAAWCCVQWADTAPSHLVGAQVRPATRRRQTAQARVARGLGLRWGGVMSNSGEGAAWR